MCNHAGRSAIRLRAPFSACLLFTLACGLGIGGQEFPEEVDLSPTASPSDSQAEDQELTVDQQFAVSQEFWHSGFRVEIDSGRFFSVENELTGDVRYLVSIAAAFENLGNHQTFFDGAVGLAWDSKSVPSLLSSDQPSVPAGLSSSGEFIFEVDETFDSSSAYILIGTGDENQARVPLGEAAGELISLEPSEPDVVGSIALELIDLGFTSAELRADRPGSYSEIEAGKLALTLYFDATSRRGGNWNIFAEDFALVLPSGNAVGVDGADLASLPGAEAGLATRDLSIRFVVDQPAAGTYILRSPPGSWFIGADGVTEGQFEFTLD